MEDIGSISDGLELGDDGVWYGAEAGRVSYPESGNEHCFAVEDGSYWFEHRNRCILTLVQSFPPVDGGVLLDVGGGNGFVAAALAKAGFMVVLLEPGRAGAVNARRRGLDTVVCATVETAGLRPESLSAVGMFDVLEHIEDDRSFLRMIARLSKPRARLYLTVPAHPLLWSRTDLGAGHFRRYRLARLRRRVEEAGFGVDFATYFFRPLVVPILLFRVLPHRLGLESRASAEETTTRDHGLKGGVGTRLLGRLLRPEVANLEAGRAMGWGSSCMLVASRR